MEQETRAIGVRCFAAQIVPGLLQIEDYARGIMDRSEPEETLDARVASRMERQAIFSRDKPVMMTCVLDESTLRRPVGGPQTMARQIDHLINAARSPFVQVLIMPFERITTEALAGDMILLSFEKEPDLVYIESGNIGYVIDNRDDVFMTRDDVFMTEVYFNRTMGEVLSQTESNEFMRRIQETYHDPSDHSGYPVAQE
nr:DUF5753 domain-containing protein [Actinomadura sp. KC345]